jgi:integrase
MGARRPVRAALPNASPAQSRWEPSRNSARRIRTFVQLARADESPSNLARWCTPIVVMIIWNTRGHDDRVRVSKVTSKSWPLQFSTGTAPWFSIGIHIYCVRRRHEARAGLGPTCSPHSFRVETATDLHDEGVLTDEIQALLGHSDVRTTNLYKRNRRGVARKLAERTRLSR